MNGAFPTIFRTLLVTFLTSCAQLAYAQVAYLWVEADAAWKTKATGYWSDVRGYGDKVPGELIRSVEQNYLHVHDNVSIRLQRDLREAKSFSRVEPSSNPTTIYPNANDVYIDLVIRVVEVSDRYPFFKKELTKFAPAAILQATIYSGRGDKLQTLEVVRNIDYKTKIKPVLNRHLSDYEKVPDEHKYICTQAFEAGVNELVAAIVKENVQFQKHSLEKNTTADVARFHKEMSLLFQERKNMYPTHYAAFDISKENPPALATSIASRGASGDEEKYAAYGDEEIANNLSERLQSVKNYALFIGINDYVDEHVDDLQNPVQDAKVLMETLTTHYTFLPEHVTLLENPTRNDIISALDHLAETVTVKDNLLIFYAGHGLYDNKLRNGFWLPRDAEENNRNNWISNSSIRDYIGGISSNHTLLIADACFSGGILKTREAFSGLTQADAQLYRLTSRKAMTSGAMKTVPDKSVFLQYLVKRLAENTKPFISSEYLFSTFKTAVINNSANGQIPQFGEIRETGDEGGDFIFIRKKDADK